MIADRMFDGWRAECELEAWLDEQFPGAYDRIGFDDYDASLEICAARTDLVLSPDQCQRLWKEGFARCWVNHINDTQTYYTAPGTTGHNYPQSDHSLSRGRPSP